MTLRADLWAIAVEQHGYFTLKDARDLDLDDKAVRMMARRQNLDHPAVGVWRFPEWPTTPADAYQLAVLWTGVSETALSHETALLVRDLSDVNPDRIHLTVSPRRRIRRRQPAPYEVHYEQLGADELDWWEGIKTARTATAIKQCIRYGTPGHLLRQAIEQARSTGLITNADQHSLTEMMEERLVRV